MRVLLVVCVAMAALAPCAVAELREVFSWKQVDFNFSNESMREEAIKSGAFKPAEALPLGVAYYGGRVFVSLPKWKGGTPATLASLPFDADFNETTSPKLNPYPNWSWHSRPENDCSGLTSVFRMRADQCGRLWVLDSGLTGIADGGKQVRHIVGIIFSGRKSMSKQKLAINQVEKFAKN